MNMITAKHLEEQLFLTRKALAPDAEVRLGLWQFTILVEMFLIYTEENMHKKIMEKAAKALKKDAAHYKKEAKQAKTKTKKKHEKVEQKEASSAAKDLKKRAKKAHEY